MCKIVTRVYIEIRQMSWYDALQSLLFFGGGDRIFSALHNRATELKKK